MALIFYPHADDTQKGSMDDRIEVLMEAAERYRAVVLDATNQPAITTDDKKPMAPRDQAVAFNWEEIARVVRYIRMLPEVNRSDKMKKADTLVKLAEVYEVLRAAKMPKLEAVRLALISESTHLRGS
ncbi:MAG: hypothetical protein WAW86_02395 [Gammaproteobacteria bacterium]